MNPPAPPGRPIVVIDTNIVLDWLVFADPSVRALSAAVQSRAVRWLACDRALAELQHVLTREQILCRHPDTAMIHATLQQHAERPAGTPASAAHLLRCTDPDDQKFLDLALHVGAAWLLSKDKALLRLARRAAPLGLRIAMPQAWTPAA